MPTSATQQIPVIDLRDYTHGTAEQKGRFVQTWGEGLRDFGFVAIEGHTIETAVIKKTYRLFQELFALPLEQKKQYERVAGGQRGYTSFGKEHAKDSTVGDLKEFWHVGRELASHDRYFDEYPSNVWPSEVPELRELTLTLFAQLEDAARLMLLALGDYFKLSDRAYFAKSIEGGNSILRAIHYPPLLPHMDPHAVRAAAHEDINLITILCEATTSGLEILTRDGTWLPVEAPEGQLVVDAGDMLQRLTNHVIPSTTHRVVNPAGANVARYSMPFFVHPYSEFDLTPIAETITPENPCRYGPVSAGDFLNERLRAIGLLK